MAKKEGPGILSNVILSLALRTVDCVRGKDQNHVCLDDVAKIALHHVEMVNWDHLSEDHLSAAVYLKNE